MKPQEGGCRGAEHHPLPEFPIRRSAHLVQQCGRDSDREDSERADRQPEMSGLLAANCVGEPVNRSGRQRDHRTQQSLDRGNPHLRIFGTSSRLLDPVAVWKIPLAVPLDISTLNRQVETRGDPRDRCRLSRKPRIAGTRSRPAGPDPRLRARRGAWGRRLRATPQSDFETDWGSPARLTGAGMRLMRRAGEGRRGS